MVDETATPEVIGTPLRERYWSEIGMKEKAERIRRTVKSLQGQINRLSKLIDAFDEHSHSDGKIFIPFSSRRWNKHEGESMGWGPENDDVYF